MNTEEDEFKRIEAEAQRRAAQDNAKPPPEWLLIKNILDEYGLQAISFVADWKAAQRQWVELTDEELSILGEKFTHPDEGIDEVAFGLEVQRILKEKNT